MAVKITPPNNPNYCATVFALNDFVDLPGMNNVKAALIFGNSVIVSKDATAGDVGLFFPVETQLFNDFLANNNLYRKAEFGNMDPEKKGFFDQHGRVRCMKFVGHKSEGFWIPISSLSYMLSANEIASLEIGAEFDCLNDRPICKKYIPRFQSHVGSGKGVKRSSKPSVRNEDKIVDGQFKFHPDTCQLERNIHMLDPEQFISISDKWHGTSAIFANVLVKRELPWYERLLQKLGVAVKTEQYGFTWSSRKIIKGVEDKPMEKGTYAHETAWGAQTGHYYKEDIWGVVGKEVKDKLPKGYTLYGEIVGFTSGSHIQKGYHYGCQPGTHRFLVYRITVTNADGRVLELSWNQLAEFCAKFGLETVKTLWYGRAGEFGSEGLRYLAHINVQDWQCKFVKELKAMYVGDFMCAHNNGEVPSEGIVLKIDRLQDNDAYKLKSFLFKEWETKQLDKGEADMETLESEDAETEVEEVAA